LKQNITDTDILTIAFPSLIRRIGGEKAKTLKAIACDFQCELKRIRRSRNWKLTGQANHLNEFAQQLKGQDVVADCSFFMEKIIESTLPYQQASLPNRLAALITSNPAVTLAELMEKTGCTIAQARLARDDEDL